MKTMFRTIALAAIAALAITGCIKHEPYVRPDHGGQGGGRTDDKLLLVLQDSWKVQYMGRENAVYDDGTTAVLEVFQMNCPGAVNLFPLIISPEDLKDVYDNDLLKFFEYEVKLLQNDAKADPSIELSQLGVYSGKQKSVKFGRHLHGTWLLYVPELDGKLNLTGKYAEYEFTIPEDPATEAFKRWYGTYHVYDRYSAFDITISDADANYLYYVDYWEVGPSVSEQMTQKRDWIYARFADGKLYFYAQYLPDEEYDGTTRHEHQLAFENSRSRTAQYPAPALANRFLRIVRFDGRIRHAGKYGSACDAAESSPRLYTSRVPGQYDGTSAANQRTEAKAKTRPREPQEE